MQVNEEKRKKFMEYAGKRVNNVLHDIQILEPMSRSTSYDFTRQDVDEMFAAMQETLNNAKAEFEKKFEEKARSEKKVFSFGSSAVSAIATETTTENYSAIDTAESAIDTTTEIANDVVSEVSATEAYDESTVETPAEVF